MKHFFIGIMLLLVTTITIASETVFEINNKLSNFDIEENSVKYLRVFDQLVDDLRENGIRFSYDGTMVKNDYRGVPYFLVKNIQVYIKKEIFEKYEKHESLLDKQTFFNDAIKRYGQSYIFSNLEYKWAKPKLKIKMELLDANQKEIFSGYIKTSSMLNDGTGVPFEHFFRYITRYKQDNKVFHDVSIAENISMFRDKEIHISLEEIQRIKSIKFKVLDNR
ncbi:hypothetical protein [Acinetobacter sp. YH12021]|uniref:hypothetical protein n=1 Tax=Acinetobacter sp. YH12021 TaxID=2601040 RepID=UPI0015D3853F|nr:hypothetical protein [Acinetobacter sp. YH12021]